MEKDWKADSLLVQKLMRPHKIGRKKQKTWQEKTYAFHFPLKSKKKKRKEKECRNSGRNIVLCQKQEECSLYQ